MYIYIFIYIFYIFKYIYICMYVYIYVFLFYGRVVSFKMVDVGFGHAIRKKILTCGILSMVPT